MKHLKSKIYEQALKLKETVKTRKSPALRLIRKQDLKTNLPLHKAVISGDLQKVTDLINNNYHIVNERDHFFKTALDYALVSKRVDIISDLVLLGARVALTFYNCQTDKEFLEILKLLERVNYNYNNIDDLGFAPIHYASGQGFHESVRFLLKHKINVNLKSVHGETALKYALKHNRSGLIAGDC